MTCIFFSAFIRYEVINYSWHEHNLFNLAAIFRILSYSHFDRRRDPAIIWKVIGCLWRIFLSCGPSLNDSLMLAYFRGTPGPRRATQARQVAHVSMTWPRVCSLGILKFNQGSIEGEKNRYCPAIKQSWGVRWDLDQILAIWKVFNISWLLPKCP